MESLGSALTQQSWLAPQNTWPTNSRLRSRLRAPPKNNRPGSPGPRAGDTHTRGRTSVRSPGAGRGLNVKTLRTVHGLALAGPPAPLPVPRRYSIHTLQQIVRCSPVLLSPTLPTQTRTRSSTERTTNDMMLCVDSSVYFAECNCKMM